MNWQKTATGIDPNAVRASSARLPSLDGLRGILAVVVMLAHYGVVNGTGKLLPYAQVAVYVFFMISAYALTVSWGVPYWVFMAKRFLRLWPVYAVTLTFGMFITRNGLQWSDYFWVPFKGFHDWIPQNPVAWSLYVEMYASLAMPLIIAVSARTRTALVAAFALAMAARFQGDLIYGVFFIAGSYATRFKFDFAFLNSALPQWLGRISYSLYLCHCGVLMVCMGAMPVLWVYVSLPLCFLAASGIYVAIEKPSIDVSRRFAKWANKKGVDPIIESGFGPI